MNVEMTARFLNRPAERVLLEVPFSDWEVDISPDDELGRIDYNFKDQGISWVCDGDGIIDTIFVGVDFFDDFLFSAKRTEVRQMFGRPYKSGPGVEDPILGVYGPHDLFQRDGYSVHVEFQANSDTVKLVSLIRDTTPGVHEVGTTIEVSIDFLTRFLNRPARELLGNEPFSQAHAKIPFEGERSWTCYTFADVNISWICELDDLIDTFFIVSGDVVLNELPFSTNRVEVRRLFGLPHQSNRSEDELTLGTWDLFKRHGHTIHVEYLADTDAIKMVTLTRDVG